MWRTQTWRKAERWSAVRQIRTSSPILFTSNRELQTRHKTQIDGSSYEPVTLGIVDTASENSILSFGQ